MSARLPRSKGGGCWVGVKVRLGEHPHSKLLDQISAKDEQLSCYTPTAVF